MSSDFSAFTRSYLPREPVRERFSHITLPPVKEEPNLNLWIDQFWRCLHVFSRVYPTSSDQALRDSYSCFFQSLAGILPSEQMRHLMRDFLTMTPTVQKVLFESKSLGSFFTVHRDIYMAIIQSPGSFFAFCLGDPRATRGIDSDDSDRLFAWSFLLHSYYNILSGLPVESFNILKSQYHASKISKETWANPLWFLMHTCAYYARPEQHCSMCFKAFMSCLRYALPCPKCRGHLGTNLENLSIDQYAGQPDGLFMYTVDLHNTVNQSLGKPTITLEEAKRIYDPYGQPLIRQNVNVSRFII